MPYLFTCPHCQTQTLVDDEFSGQEGQCVMCAHPIQLPAFAGTAKPTQAAPRRDLRILRWILAGAFAVAILTTLGILATRYAGRGVQTMQANRLRGRCMVNLQQIANAMNAYAKDYGSYPPPVTMSADNKTPMHSWRVLILPYLGYQQLYDEFRMDEPWSSETNQTAATEIPTEYQSPAAVQGFGQATNYFLITGAGTLFPPGGPLGPDDVLDDPGKTILIVETASPPITSLQWSEPGDFNINQISFAIGTSIGGNHVGGATIATVDNQGHWLRESVDANVVRALITPAGGEGISDDVLQ